MFLSTRVGKFVLLAGLLIPTAFYGQTISPSDDAHVSSAFPGTNFGANPQLQVGYALFFLLEYGRVVQGAPGWISGYTNAFPRTCIDLFEACTAGDMERALPLYRMLHPLLRWDSKVEFVQAIKLSMDIVGRYGGPCRPPRIRLTDEHTDTVRMATERALAAAAH